MSDDAPLILLVEDDSMLAEIARFRLELLGYAVVTVASAEQAQEWLGGTLPCLIVVDQILPEMNGIELIKRLKSSQRTAEVPVLMLSNRANLYDVQAAFDAGADDYLVTPFDPLVLERKVESLVTETSSA